MFTNYAEWSLSIKARILKNSIFFGEDKHFVLAFI